MHHEPLKGKVEQLRNITTCKWNNQSGQFSWKTEGCIIRPLFLYHSLCSTNRAIQESLVEAKYFSIWSIIIFSLFLKKKFWNHKSWAILRESLKYWLGLVHLMLLYRKKPNSAPRINTTANSEFFKKNFINRNLVFAAKTGKWPLFLGF